MQREGVGVVVCRGHPIAVVGAFLIGCTVLLMVVGCAGVRSEASKQEEQGNTEATKEQERSSEATASEEARCEGTRTYKDKFLGPITTNDIPGCPKGGLLSGTDKQDRLDGEDGDDEIRGLGAIDSIEGGDGNDVIYGGPGSDFLSDGDGEDVLHGGAGNDGVLASGLREDGHPDKLYCGPGKDVYDAGKLDYVDSSCEKKKVLVRGL
jgi:RTX calcium-binding nonapeptide repeat (4 copies)